eukprot:5036496-Lingulodinium_polyedra.AAC.1
MEATASFTSPLPGGFDLQGVPDNTLRALECFIPLHPYHLGHIWGGYGSDFPQHAARHSAG